jgi:GntR family transcriptional regulator
MTGGRPLAFRVSRQVSRQSHGVDLKIMVLVVYSFMRWSVDPRNPLPLHEQIAVNVRQALSEGGLAPGERLPPASELAAVLEINPNTVLRAYRNLREDGVLEFRRGRAVRVCDDAAVRASVVQAARQLLAAGRACGYSPSALAALLEELA